MPPASARRRWVHRWFLHACVTARARLVVRGRELLEGPRRPPGERPRVLVVLHDAVGGVRETTRDLLSSLDRRFECFVLTGSPTRLELLRHTCHGLDPQGSWWLHRAWSHQREGDAEHRAAYLALLDRVRPDLVHIRHLLGHTDELVELCHRRRVPMVLSFHDYYMACPGIHLLDDQGRYCAGQCTPSRGQCRIPVPWLQDLPVLKAGYLDAWRGRVRAMLARIDVFVATSQASLKVLLGVYPELARRELHVIEHGRDFAAQLELATVPPVCGPVRIAVPGHMHFHKGSEFLRLLEEHDREREDRFELHFFGTADPTLRRIGIHHGTYRRSELPSKLAILGVSFVGIFSVWPETYCHTLTEAWAMGIPVLASGLGAQGDRVRSHGGGWVVPVDDVAAAYREVLRVVADPEEYRRVAARARLDGEHTVERMGRAYDHLYSRLLAARSGREHANPG